MRQEVERQEKTNIHLEQKFTSLEDEVEVKTVKLKKLIKRFQESKNEIKDMKAQNQREREDLWEMRRELQRQIQLKQLIIDNFIPPSLLSLKTARYIKIFSLQDPSLPSSRHLFFTKTRIFVQYSALKIEENAIKNDDIT